MYQLPNLIARVPVILALVYAPPAIGQDTAVAPTLDFANRTWRVKHGQGLMGPGPNHFSADRRDVWVDDAGHLHMALNHRDGKWLSTEVISDWPVGYGTYEFRLAGGAHGGASGDVSGVDQLDPNIVLGLFTWDSDAWQTDANSEIDIELTRWCEADAPNLHYSVHPAWGPDGKHPERYKAETIDLKGEPSTHVITWSPDGVECAIYLGGDGPDPEKLITQWRFDANNPPRVTGNAEGDTTDPIVIPKPHAGTTVRINLWLVDGDRDKLGDPPTDGQPAEVVITGFSYTPAELPEQTE